MKIDYISKIDKNLIEEHKGVDFCYIKKSVGCFIPTFKSRCCIFMGNYNSWEFWTYYRNHLTGKIEKSPQRFMLTLEDAYRLLVEYLQSDEIVEILSFDYGRITGIYL